jgi:hypothetical protein
MFNYIIREFCWFAPDKIYDLSIKLACFLLCYNAIDE